MSEAPPRRLCPIVHVADVEPCAPVELEPLVAHLRANAAVSSATTFARGTVFADGRLDLCKQSLGPGGARVVFDALAGNAHVRHILLGTDGLGQEGAEVVARHIEGEDGLETVFLGCNAIPVDGVARLGAAIGGSGRVRAVWLKRNLLGVEGSRHVAAMLRGRAPIEVLDLVNTELGDEGVAEVCEAAAGHATLQWLYLGGNGLTAAGVAAVASMLRRTPGLRGLSLAVSRLGDAGVEALVEGFGPGSGLESLLLPSNDVGPEGVEVLCAGLAGVPGLRRLDLGLAPSTVALGERPNRLGDAGASTLAAWLATDLALAWLDVRGNGMTSRAGLAIEAALAHNGHLCRLRLGKNVSRRIKRRLAVRLGANAAQHGGAGEMPWHVAAIQSVYRT